MFEAAIYMNAAICFAYVTRLYFSRAITRREAHMRYFILLFSFYVYFISPAYALRLCAKDEFYIFLSAAGRRVRRRYAAECLRR